MKENKQTSGAETTASNTPTAPDLAALADQTDAFEQAMAGQIRAKRAAGLTREQAITVCKAQVRFDAARAAQAKKA